jgi:hypothetical protein
MALQPVLRHALFPHLHHVGTNAMPALPELRNALGQGEAAELVQGL